MDPSPDLLVNTDINVIPVIKNAEKQQKINVQDIENKLTMVRQSGFLKLLNKLLLMWSVVIKIFLVVITITFLFHFKPIGCFKTNSLLAEKLTNQKTSKMKNRNKILKI